VGEAQFSLRALLRDLEDDISAVPFGLVLHEIDVAVEDVPDDFLARHQLGDLLGGAVQVLLSVRKFGTEFVGATVNLS